MGYGLCEKYFPEFTDYWIQKTGRKPLPWSAHSVWFAILGEHGFLGFFLWLGLIGSCILSLRQIHSYGKAHRDSSWLIYSADMVQSALITFLVVGTFLDAAYFDMFYYLVAVIIIMKSIIKRETARSALSVTADINRGLPASA